jgi:hypothetical protein
VIFSFIMDKSLRTFSNYYILNLSLADLLIGLLIPWYLPFLLENYQWKIGRVSCITWLILDYVVGSASVLCIVVISLDRYYLVSRGLSYLSSQNSFKTLLVMFSVWFIAFLNYGPAIFFWEWYKKGKEGSCQAGFNQNFIYLVASACVEFFVPLVSICLLNIAIYLNIRRRSKGIIQNDNNTEHSVVLSLKLKNTKNVESEKTRRKSVFQFKISTLKKDKKAAHFLFIIVIIFFICWVILIIYFLYLN